MRINLFYITMIATISLVCSCSNEEFFAENSPEAERTISLTATIPSDEPTTRVDLTQDGKNISLTWVMGDEIELLFKQGANEITRTATVTAISNEGKRAQFEIVIPQEITAGSFDLYGVYGGGGLLSSDPTLAILPSSTVTTSLNDPYDFNSVESMKDVMLYFASRGIDAADPQVSVAFKHLGSLFSVTLTNAGTTDYNDLQGGALVGVGDNKNWAYNSKNSNKNFDLVNEVFLDIESAEDYLLFKPERQTIESGSSITFWGWYPPLPGVVWPELTFEIFDSSGNVEYRTVNSKPARTEPTLPGKSYYFYVVLDDTELRFNAGSIIDSRDGNIYQTVAIGNQVWMSENLRYLPSVTYASDGSNTNPKYYVYDYDEVGGDVEEAKGTESYTTYGVLYNWPAAKGYTLPPSGGGDVCPEGWHLPNDVEWTELVDYLGGATVAGAKLKETGTDHWNSESNGVTNESEFTAVPGGFRGGGLYGFGFFEGMGDHGSWWSSTDNVAGTWHRGLFFGSNVVYRVNYDKDYGFSVRCVKDDVNAAM